MALVAQWKWVCLVRWPFQSKSTSFPPEPEASFTAAVVTSAGNYFLVSLTSRTWSTGLVLPNVPVVGTDVHVGLFRTEPSGSKRHRQVGDWCCQREETMFLCINSTKTCCAGAKVASFKVSYHLSASLSTKIIKKKKKKNNLLFVLLKFLCFVSFSSGCCQFLYSVMMSFVVIQFFLLKSNLKAASSMNPTTCPIPELTTPIAKSQRYCNSLAVA